MIRPTDGDGKWAVQHKVRVPQYRSKKRRRVLADWIPVDIEARGKFRIARLQRPMQQVPGHDCSVVVPPEAYRDMVRRVTWSWQEADIFVNRMVVADEFRPAGFHDREDAIAERRRWRLGVLLGPIVEFAFRKQIARLGESRDPPPVKQPRVPTDVIDMHVSAHHEVDVLDAKTSGGERAHEGFVALQISFGSRRPDLVVSDAAVDQNGVARGLHEIGLESEHQLVVPLSASGASQ